MKLTKKEALEITVELWKYIDKTEKSKFGWSGWEKYGHLKNYCSCCEYVNQFSRIKIEDVDEPELDCKNHCPLYEAWPYDYTIYNGGCSMPCEHKDSPYHKDDAKTIWKTAKKILRRKEFKS